MRYTCFVHFFISVIILLLFAYYIAPCTLVNHQKFSLKRTGKYLLFGQCYLLSSRYYSLVQALLVLVEENIRVHLFHHRESIAPVAESARHRYLLITFIDIVFLLQLLTQFSLSTTQEDG